MNVSAYVFLVAALIAFAANSVLCRLALAAGEIDPNGFTIVRLISGAITLAIILLVRQMQSTKVEKHPLAKGSWLGAVSLFIYALGFSYAYIQLDTGTGALILFGSVQLSMIAYGLYQGERFNAMQWCGMLSASFGLLYLLWPALSTPSIYGAVLMIIAGLAWGLYSIIGKTSRDALANTAFNFIRSALFAVILLLVSIPYLHFSSYGFLLAVASGSLASGLGYAMWYAVLPNLSSMHASVAQLSVPIIAALGAVILVNEPFSLHLAIASLLVLGGVLVVIKLKTSV